MKNHGTGEVKNTNALCIYELIAVKETPQIIKITWQRLLIDESGQTCPRCGSTEKELEKALDVLKKSLAPLEIEVILEKKALDSATFAKDVLESNRIWISERPLKETDSN
jgi:hypothetical protein